MLTDFAPALYLELDALRTLVFDLLQICFFFALATMLVVQILKYFVKPQFQRRVFQRWLKTLFHDSEEHQHRLREDLPDFLIKNYGDFLPAETDIEKVPQWIRCLEQERSAVLDYPQYVFRLPRRLFMKQVENDIQVILSNPNTYRAAFISTTNGAAAAYKLETMAWTATARERLKMDHQDPSGASIAFDVVSEAAQRNLDSLQLRLSLMWVDLVRRYAIMIGGLFGFLMGMILWFAVRADPAAVNGVQQLFDTPTNFVLVFVCVVLGLISGFLSSFLYDVFGNLLRWNHDRL